jgi:hypothetical protein
MGAGAAYARRGYEESFSMRVRKGKDIDLIGGSWKQNKLSRESLVVKIVE